MHTAADVQMTRSEGCHVLRRGARNGSSGHPSVCASGFLYAQQFRVRCPENTPLSYASTQATVPERTQT